MLAVKERGRCQVNMSLGNGLLINALLEYGCYLVFRDRRDGEEKLFDVRRALHPNADAMHPVLEMFYLPSVAPSLPLLALVTLLNCVFYLIVGSLVPHILQLEGRRRFLHADVSILLRAQHPAAAHMTKFKHKPPTLATRAEGAVGAGGMPRSLWARVARFWYPRLSLAFWKANAARRAVEWNVTLLTVALAFGCIAAAVVTTGEGGAEQFVWASAGASLPSEQSGERYLFALFVYVVNSVTATLAVLLQVHSIYCESSFRHYGAGVADTGLGGFKTKSELERDAEHAAQRYKDEPTPERLEAYERALEVAKAAADGPPLHACTKLAHALEATVLHEEETQPEIAPDPEDALRKGFVWGLSQRKLSSMRKRSSSRQRAASSVAPMSAVSFPQRQASQPSSAQTPQAN